ncbi:MAG: hypothetical protein ACE15C_14075 [Phycisphaerae bacterium]
MNLQLKGVTYKGQPIKDFRSLQGVPPELACLLSEVNGFVAFDGGLHVRGICDEPLWHSLREAWCGEEAIFRLFQSVKETDVPFAQDCLGDQYLLRSGMVHRLSAETDEVSSVGVSLDGFLDKATKDPFTYLSLQPLVAMRREGKALAPGQLIGVYPPFCLKESACGASLAPVPALEQLKFLSVLSSHIRSIPDGGLLSIKIVQEGQNGSH